MRHLSNPNPLQLGCPAWVGLKALIADILSLAAGRALKISRLLFLAAASASLAHGGQAGQNEDLRCPKGRAIETDGVRRLALIIGVGRYKSPRIEELEGPRTDAENLYRLLTGPGGYGFPRRNACILLDSQATGRRFREAFRETLMKRARSGDVAVLFFAGHGSQSDDRNGDESDGFDETLLLHDADEDPQGSIIDDEFNLLLAELQKRTRNIEVMIDACHSGSATRIPSGLRSRFQEPIGGSSTRTSPFSGGPASSAWTPEGLEGVAVLTASADGSEAFEVDGQGVFTKALLQALRGAAGSPLTYGQLDRRIRRLMGAENLQVPFFEGDRDKQVFSSRRFSRPIAWEVRSLTPHMELAGPPIAGVEIGAEFRIHDGASPAERLGDPAHSRATAVVTATKGMNAIVEIKSRTPGTGPIAPGDLAVLIQPGDQSIKLRIRIRPENDPGGLPPGRSNAIRRRIREHPEAQGFVHWVDRDWEYEIALSHRGQIQLMGTELLGTVSDRRLEMGTVLSRRQLGTESSSQVSEWQQKGTVSRILRIYPGAGEGRSVAESLWRLARRKALLLLNGENGSDLKDGHTLQVRVVPAPSSRGSACISGKWTQAPANRPQMIPLCYEWNVEVQLDPSSMPLLVGGVVISADGEMQAFPADGRQQLLNPGETCIFKSRRETFFARPPLDAPDYVVVFGTQPSNPVPWMLLGDPASGRDSGTLPRSGLLGDLERRLHSKALSEPSLKGALEDGAWTKSSVMIRVRANPQLDSLITASTANQERTLPIASFDIRPYLPDDRDSGLYRILRLAAILAQPNQDAGARHRPKVGPQPDNLGPEGLTSASKRAIWQAFRAAGLADVELPQEFTSFGPSSGPPDGFSDCRREVELRIGDVLVFQQESEADARALMVIDSRKRVVWGALDGKGTVFNGKGTVSNRKGTVFGSGADSSLARVGFQVLGRIPGGDAQGLSQGKGMSLCWRHRRLAEEWNRPGGRPGVEALGQACREAAECGRPEWSSGKPFR